MTLLDSASSFLSKGASFLHDRDVTVLVGDVLTEGLDRGTLSFDPGTVQQVVRCSPPQIADLRAQELAGLIVKEGRYRVFSEPIRVTPETHRLVIDETTYQVVGLVSSRETIVEEL